MVAGKIKKNIAAGNPIAQHDSYLITNLLKNTPLMKKYEDEVGAEKEKAKQKRSPNDPIPVEIIRQIEREVFGLHFDDKNS